VKSPKDSKDLRESGDLQGRVGGLIASYSLQGILDSPNSRRDISSPSLFVDAQFENFKGSTAALLKRVFLLVLGANPILQEPPQKLTALVV